jgi:hypothetical protein
MKFEDQIHIQVLIRSGNKVGERSFICGKELTLNEDDPVLITCYEKTIESLKEEDIENINVAGFVISVYLETPK